MTNNSKVISIVTSKGGVGKSTVCLGLAGHFSKTHKVLLIDLDYQCNLTNTWGAHTRRPTVYDCLCRGSKFIPVSLGPSLELLQGDVAMSRFAISMQGNSYSAFALRDFCEKLEYDVIIVDSPVSDLESRNAIQASDILLSVVEPEEYSFENIGPFIESLQNDRAKLDGIVINKVYKNYKVHKQVIRKFQDYYSDLVYETMIPTDVEITKAQQNHQLLIDYSPNSRANEAFGKLKKEVWEQLKK